MKKLRLSPQAQDDLQEIWDCLSGFSVDAADRTVEAIADAYFVLLDSPFAGRSREDLLPGLRNWSVKKYLIFYVVGGDLIIIARILHGARDVEAIFSPLEQ